MKNIFIDIETTGTRYNQSGIIQIAGIIEIDGEFKEEFNIKCRPFPTDKVDDEALKIQNLTLHEVTKRQEPEKAFKQFISILERYVDRFDKKDKFNFIAYRAEFDESNLRYWFRKNNDKYFGSYFFYPTFCVLQRYAWDNIERRAEIENMKLITVAKEVLGEDNVKEENAHDAMYDINLTRYIFKHIMKNSKNCKKVKV